MTADGVPSPSSFTRPRRRNRKQNENKKRARSTKTGLETFGEVRGRAPPRGRPAPEENILKERGFLDLLPHPGEEARAAEDDVEK
ncbi:hypothetical protein HMPREF9440_00614, partial [Sutterella parvirubra YIT 11816]